MNAIKLLLSMGMALIAASTVWAEQTNYAIGGAAAAELRLGLGARPAAMGEAFVGIADDANASTWNPAGLGRVAGMQAGFMHYLYLEDMSFDYVTYAQNLMPESGLGVALAYYNFGKFDRLDENGLGSETFSPAAYSLTAAYGQKVLPEVYAGLGVKVVQEKIDTDQYTAVGVDLGMQWQAPGEFKTALVVQNLGSDLAGSPLSRQVKAGVAHAIPLGIQAGDTWQAALDVAWPLADAQYVSVNVGTEYWFQNTLALRLGYKAKNQSDLGGVTGLTAGVGAKYAMLNLDYALVSFGALGLTHQVSVGVGF